MLIESVCGCGDGPQQVSIEHPFLNMYSTPRVHLTCLNMATWSLAHRVSCDNETTFQNSKVLNLQNFF